MENIFNWNDLNWTVQRKILNNCCLGQIAVREAISFFVLSMDYYINANSIMINCYNIKSNRSFLFQNTTEKFFSYIEKKYPELKNEGVNVYFNIYSFICDLDRKSEEFVNISRQMCMIYMQQIENYYPLSEPELNCLKSPYDFYNLQGITSVSLHFENSNVKNVKNEVYGDYPRSRSIEDEQKRQMSGYLTTVFFDHQYLNSEQPPSDETVMFYLAVDCLLPDENDVKQKLARIINEKDESKLTDEQKKLKQNFKNPNYRKSIIEIWKNTFKPMPEVDYQNAGKNAQLPDRNRLVYIMHAPSNQLIPKEQEFRKVYLNTNEDENERMSNA